MILELLAHQFPCITVSPACTIECCVRALVPSATSPVVASPVVDSFFRGMANNDRQLLCCVSSLVELATRLRTTCVSVNKDELSSSTKSLLRLLKKRDSWETPERLLRDSSET